jgi:hypothetical protein
VATPPSPAPGALTGPTEIYPVVRAAPPSVFAAPSPTPRAPAASPPVEAAPRFPPHPVASVAPVTPAPAPRTAQGSVPWAELGTPKLNVEWGETVDPPRRRSGALLGVAAASIAALLVAAVIVVALVARPGGHNAAGPAPSTTQALKVTDQGAPTDVRLEDKQTSITVTWTDPSGGVAALAVLGGQPNQQPQLLKVLDPGTKSWTHEGINDGYDYCYIVAAFYKADGEQVAARSKQVCTHRHG